MVSYEADSDHAINRLTVPGHHHTEVYVSLECNIFVSVYSSIEHPPICDVYRLHSRTLPTVNSSTAASQPVAPKHPIAQLFSIKSQDSPAQPSRSPGAKTPEKRYKPSANLPKLFSFNNVSNDEIFGLLYHPENYC